RTRQALATGAETVATNCPFCMTMISDGVAAEDQSGQVQVLDVAEMLLKSVKPSPEVAAVPE
ncbi:MAG TPA: hypothetical protein VNT01_09825, partial [Symbiobacteriaceae bacterium]|nr:hypothetical protein [Symbiobacteriaceae bacterium]